MLYNHEFQIDFRSVRVVDDGCASAVGVNLICSDFGRKGSGRGSAADYDEIFLREFSISVEIGHCDPVLRQYDAGPGQKFAGNGLAVLAF
jgi:hypothetical protein